MSFTVSAKAEDTPSISINYQDETLTGFDNSASYTINGTAVTLNNGTLAAADYMGQTISIVRTARDADYTDSSAQSLQVPTRPAAPGAKITVKKTDTSITITNKTDFSGCEFSADRTNWQNSKEFTGLTAGHTYPVSVRAKATDTAFASNSQTVDVTTVNADGSTTVKPGESAETGTDPKTTVTNDGEKVTITTGGGTTTTVIPPTGGEVEPKGDGTVEVPDGTIVKPGNGGPEVTVGPGNGGTVGGDGGVTVPGGGKVTIEGDPDTTITLPSGGGTVKPTEGGVTVPGGSTVQTGDTTITIPEGGGDVKPTEGGVTVPGGSTIKPGNGGPEITVGPGNGGTIGGDEGIIIPGGGTAQVGTSPSTTITVPEGCGTIQPKPGGTVEVPGGSTIKTGDDGPEITIGPGNGGTVGGDGGITVPSGGTVQVGKDPATTITPPAGGEVKPKEDGTVEVPEGTTVKPGGGGPEVTVGPGNGGTVGDDGGVTVEGGGKVTVKGDPDDSTITLPSGGGTVKPNPDGTIPLPGGSTVEKGGTTSDVPDTGGTYNPSTGTVTENVHTVTFDSQGGSAVNSATATHGGKVVKPGNPSRSGYTFGGWYKESACTNAWNFDTDTVTGDITLYAKWTQNSGGGGGWYNPPSVTTYPVTTPATFPHGKRDDISLREKEKEINRDITDGIDTVGKKMTVCQLYAKQNSQRADVKRGTKKKREYLMGLLRDDPLGGKSIDAVKPSDAKEWAIRMREKGFSYQSISNYKRSLRAAFFIAIEDDCIRKNPFSFALNKVLEDDRGEKTVLTPEQEVSLIDFAQNDPVYQKYADELIILLGTGLRISEFCGLTTNLDFRNRLIQVDHQLLRDSENGYYIETPKTKNGYREIPMSEPVYRALKRVVKNRGKKATITVDGYTNFLFLKKDGTPRVGANYNAMIKGLVKKYNKQHKEQLPNITPHSLRHTFCTRMANAGMNPKALQYIMGHANITMTLDYYTHVDACSVKAEMERLAA